MEQKEINYRIAMSMLMQCRLMWELCTKCKAKGEFLLKDVLDMRGKIMEGHKRTRVVKTEISYCRYPDVLHKKLKLVPGMYAYDLRDHTMNLFIGTSDTDLKQGFHCSYLIEDVFVRCYQFCRRNGYPSLLKKAVLCNDADVMYVRLPEWKIPKERVPVRKPVATKPSAKVAVTKITIDPKAVLEAARVLAKKRKIA